METDQVRTADPPSLALERHYPVAPEKVWRAWTEPQALSRWFGPDGPQNVSLAELDVRVGGGTDFEFRHERFFDATVRDNHRRGWSGTFDKLGQFLRGELQS